ncbi:hypothetical protein EI94DRAFT_1704060 [Lactarius quietus]|nr:hypothetical protein EI94DRAFT_1704060 [Lactarius quietus]
MQLASNFTLLLSGLEAMGRCSHPSPPLSPFDDLKPLPPSQPWSCSGMSCIRGALWHWRARCWVGIIMASPAAFLGQLLTPAGGQVGEEEKQGRAGVAYLSFIESCLESHCCHTSRLEAMRRCSYPPPPLSPSDNLRPLVMSYTIPVDRNTTLSFTTAELQWGEPCLVAFDTSAHVAGLEKRKVGQGRSGKPVFIESWPWRDTVAAHRGPLTHTDTHPWLPRPHPPSLNSLPQTSPSPPAHPY